MLPFRGRRPNLMLLLSSRASTHSKAPFFSLSQKGSLHFTASSSANSHWTNVKFCSLLEQILLFNLTQHLNSLELAVEREIWHLEAWSSFFCKVYSENVNKIVHFICHCIHHSILFRTVLVICIDDFCNGRTVCLKWVTVRGCTRFKRNTWVTTQQPSIDW